MLAGLWDLVQMFFEALAFVIAGAGRLVLGWITGGRRAKPMQVSEPVATTTESSPKAAAPTVTATSVTLTTQAATKPAPSRNKRATSKKSAAKKSAPKKTAAKKPTRKPAAPKTTPATKTPPRRGIRLKQPPKGNG